ncbi:UNVERIFIED_CONTAM: hypothetical protein PYX00_011289 [Menopon gallinae]|uniref:Glucose-6-phosphate 1-dehydrogenase n=1 Tax=Menopon gallinae TaxID=328185 RepID=A0AAW2H716_9NEOP
MTHTQTPAAEGPRKNQDVQHFLQSIRIMPCASNYTVGDALHAYETRKEVVLSELKIRRVQENVRNKICGERSSRVDLVFHRDTHEDIASDMSCLLSEDGDTCAHSPGDSASEECCSTLSDSMHDSASAEELCTRVGEPSLFLSSVADIYNNDGGEYVEYADEVTVAAVDGLPVFDAAQDLIRRKLEEKDECDKSKKGMDRIVIFGASGDLAKRMLFPALSKLGNTKVAVVGYARTKMDDRTFKARLGRLGEYDSSFLERVSYISGSYDNIGALEVTPTTVFYISTPPHLYKVLVRQLVVRKASVIALEKPFGENLSDFQDIMRLLENRPTKTYFVDHYLCKPMTMAMPEMFASNCRLKSLLSRRTVSAAEVLFKEKLGVEGRSYFDKCGLVKDVVQNHVSEIIGTICTASGADKLCLFESAQAIDAKMCMFGQYREYKEEMGSGSRTETFCIVPLYFNEESWRNVPFVIVAGKGLDEKRCEIRLEMRKDSFDEVLQLAGAEGSSAGPAKRMWIVFNYSPREEVFIEMLRGGATTECILYRREDIQAMAAARYGDHSDHRLVLDALLSMQPFPHTKAQEARTLWRIFDCGMLERSDLIEYIKGESVPAEGVSLIEAIGGAGK